jgi:hypothetical protein
MYEGFKAPPIAPFALRAVCKSRRVVAADVRAVSLALVFPLRVSPCLLALPSRSLLHEVPEIVRRGGAAPA